jgi:ubiquinone biosynthesis accessory factor UbiK
MFDTNFIKNLTNDCATAISNSIGIPSINLEKHIQTILKSKLNKLDIVSREEFDIQSKVLLKTRLKLEELSNKLNSLS